MSKKFKLVKNYYDTGRWNILMVKDAVVKNWITPEEYLEITGEEFK